MILNLGHFLRRLGSREAVIESLVWAPTWHQARLVARPVGVPDVAVREVWTDSVTERPGDELLALCRLIVEALGRRDA